MGEIKRQLNQEEYERYIQEWKEENKELIESGKCRKVFIENLPSKFGVKNKINWKESIGCIASFIYEDIQGEIKISNYLGGCPPKIELNFKGFKCNIGVEDFKNSQIGRILNKRTSNFKIEIGTTFKDEKRDITIIDRKYRQKEQLDKEGRKSVSSQKWYKYLCNECSYKGWVVENSVLKQKTGCPCCANQIVVEGINDIPTTAPWMVKYFQDGYDEAKLYTYRSSKKANLICPHCGRITNKRIVISNLYANKSIGCSCSDKKSYISKFMFSLLEQLKEQNQINDFETEIKFDWCNYYNPFKNKESFGIYDFVIENNKLIIETDGGFHRRDNDMSGQSKEQSKWLDDIKDKLALENGYKVIRVSDEGNIKENILNSQLIKMFNLSMINWIQCEEFACKNLVKEVCEYWNNEKEDKNVKDLVKIFKVSDGTIRNYLKVGNQNGWSNYDVEKESRKGKRKAGQMGAKPVEILKNRQSLGIFFSVTQLERQSKKLFGVKLLQGQISSVARGERNSYKGFTFKYIIENKLKEIEEVS